MSNYRITTKEQFSTKADFVGVPMMDSVEHHYFVEADTQEQALQSRAGLNGEVVISIEQHDQ